MSDQFFEEEEELARAEDASARASKAKSRQAAPRPAAKPAPKAAPVAGAPQPPSFARVCVIAAVALLLGVCIGYFAAMMVVGSADDTDHPATTGTPVVSTADGATEPTDAASMPSDHPDISAMINPDGTVNEQALAEYKAQRAAEQAAAGDAASEDSSSK